MVLRPSACKRQAFARLGVAAELERSLAAIKNESANMTLLIYTVFGFLAVGALGAHWSFSSLIEIEHTKFHDQWVADGKPIGGKSARKEATFFSPSMPRELFYRWMSSTPDWIAQSPEAQFWHRHLRFWGILFHITFFAFIAVIINSFR